MKIVRRQSTRFYGGTGALIFPLARSPPFSAGIGGPAAPPCLPSSVVNLRHSRWMHPGVPSLMRMLKLGLESLRNEARNGRCCRRRSSWTSWRPPRVTSLLHPMMTFVNVLNGCCKATFQGLLITKFLPKSDVSPWNASHMYLVNLIMPIRNIKRIQKMVL